MWKLLLGNVVYRHGCHHLVFICLCFPTSFNRNKLSENQSDDFINPEIQGLVPSNQFRRGQADDQNPLMVDTLFLCDPSSSAFALWCAYDHPGSLWKCRLWFRSSVGGPEILYFHIMLMLVVHVTLQQADLSDRWRKISSPYPFRASGENYKPQSNDFPGIRPWFNSRLPVHDWWALQLTTNSVYREIDVNLGNPCYLSQL